jgi:hypothetical protein
MLRDAQGPVTNRQWRKSKVQDGFQLCLDTFMHKPLLDHLSYALEDAAVGDSFFPFGHGGDHPWTVRPVEYPYFKDGAWALPVSLHHCNGKMS